jgi:hypothetical protein
MRALVIAVGLLLVSSPAHAEKKKKTALALTGVGTGVSGGLILASFLVHPQDLEVNKPLLYTGLGTSIVTPSLGHFYAGKFFTVGMGIRAAAAGLAAYGVSQNQDQPCDVDPNQNCPTLTGTGFTVLALAAIAYIGGVAYDVRTTPDSVERYNKFHAQLVPTVTRGGGGLALGGRF